jgi:hypothetical protein
MCLGANQQTNHVHLGALVSAPGLSELGVGFGVFFDAAQQWATLAGLLALLAAYPWALSLRFHSPAGFFVTCGDAHTVRRVRRASVCAHW